LHISPGDPAEIMLGPQATHEDITRLRTELGLDEPLPVQYARWMGRVLQGDLGRSLWMKRPVLGEVLRRFQATVVLAASALLLSCARGRLAGGLRAARPPQLATRSAERAGLALRRQHAELLARHRADGDLRPLARVAARVRHVRALWRRWRGRPAEPPRAADG